MNLVGVGLAYMLPYISDIPLYTCTIFLINGTLGASCPLPRSYQWSITDCLFHQFPSLIKTWLHGKRISAYAADCTGLLSLVLIIGQTSVQAPTLPGLCVGGFGKFILLLQFLLSSP